MKPFLRQLIQTDKLEEVFKLLDSCLPHLSQDLQNQFILQNGRYKSILTDERQGTVTKHETKAAVAQIRKNLLELLPELPDDLPIEIPTSSKRKVAWSYFVLKHSRKIAAALGLLLVAGIITLNYLPKLKFNVELEVNTDHLDFVVKEKHNIHLDFITGSVQVQNLESAVLSMPQLVFTSRISPVNDTISIDPQLGGHFSFEPIMEGEDNNLMLEGLLSLNTLKIPRHALVSLENADVPSNSKGSLGIRLSPGNLSGEITISDEAAFEVSQMRFKQHGSTESSQILSFKRGLFPLNPGKSGKIGFTGRSELSSLHIRAVNDTEWLYELPNINLPIDSVSFQRVDLANQTIRSGIKGVAGKLLAKDGKIVKTISIPDGNHLFLKKSKGLIVKDLWLGEKQIKATLIGQVGDLYEQVGGTKQSAYSLSPTWLSWHWSNNKLLLCLILTVLLATIIFLLSLSRRFLAE